MSGQRATPCRKFNLLDGMILLFIAAQGFAGSRNLLVAGLGGNRTDGIIALAELFLMLASVWILVARLRQPRPPLRQVANQPGAVACFWPVSVAFANDVAWLARSWLEGMSVEVGPIGKWIWVLLELPSRRWACVVPIGWMYLIAARRWRPEPGWIDRSGFVVGLGWIVWGLVGAFL